MPIEYIFWMLVILTLVLGVVFNWPGAERKPWSTPGNFLLLFVLIVMLGLRVFGPMVK